MEQISLWKSVSKAYVNIQTSQCSRILRITLAICCIGICLHSFWSVVATTWKVLAGRVRRRTLCQSMFKTNSIWEHAWWSCKPVSAYNVVIAKEFLDNSGPMWVGIDVLVLSMVLLKKEKDIRTQASTSHRCIADISSCPRWQSDPSGSAYLFLPRPRQICLRTGCGAQCYMLPHTRLTPVQKVMKISYLIRE